MGKQQSSFREHEEPHPYAGLLHELILLRTELKVIEHASAATLQQVNPLHAASAINMVHYLGIRRRDMRPLQEGIWTFPDTGQSDA